MAAEVAVAVAAVEVVYALPKKQWIVSVHHEDGMTAIEAVRRSGLLESHPEIAEGPLVLGLFGVEIEHERDVADGDRVEICRPLAMDPREMRRRAVAAGLSMGQGGTGNTSGSRTMRTT